MVRQKDKVDFFPDYREPNKLLNTCFRQQNSNCVSWLMNELCKLFPDVT